MASIERSLATPVARRKSSKSSLKVTFKLPSVKLQRFADQLAIKNESSPSSTPSILLPVAASSSSDHNSQPASTTPGTNGTPTSLLPTALMPPPTEAPKKKGGKRAAGVTLMPDGLPKPRGKPGPKKKARLEDGSIDHSATVPRAANGTAHKLGPKANQGAINAGLRALDRSGKPCRKWQKGGFKLKTFTGVTWEIPRWTAPPKITVESKPAEGSTSEDSSKENKDHSQIESEKSNSGLDVEMANSTALSQNASSPAASNANNAPVTAGFVTETSPVAIATA